MPTAQLSNRTALLVEGPEAEHFLQNILTTDLDQLGPGDALPGALLSPQGKILFDFLISRSNEGGFLLDCREELADDFLRRLMLYKLRAKVEISKRDQLVVLARWESESGSSGDDSITSDAHSVWVSDKRFPQEARVALGYDAAATPDAAHEDWTAVKIAFGIAESGDDYAPGDAFPHDVLMDETGGVGFRKGCYVGQEVVSRMQHRGTARRRVMLVSGERDLPSGRAEVTAGGRAIGTLGSVVGRQGLAIVRIDRVADALAAGQSIEARGVPVSLTGPGWARYNLPQQDAGTEGG